MSDVLDERMFEPLGLADTELVNNTREGFVGQGSGGVVSTLSDLAHLVRRADPRRRALRPYAAGAALRRHGVLAGHRPRCRGAVARATPPTAADPEPYLYAFHDGGDVRVVYVPSRDVVMAMRFSRPLYDERRLADGLDDFVFAVVDLQGEPVGASAGDER